MHKIPDRPHYGGFVELDRVQWNLVNSLAGRIVQFAEHVAEAHELGHGPGRFREPWGIDYQRRACSIYAETLPAEYLRGMAEASGYCADLMEAAASGDSVSADWEFLVSSLRSTAEVLHGMPEVAAVAVEVAAEVGSVPLGVLCYEQFAELLHPTGVARLEEAATAVARHCESRLGVAPSAQELEWIISVAAQEPIEALAECNNTSTRNMYRLLGAMWKRLGVQTPVQGVAFAVQQGWIAPPPFGPSKP